VGTNLKILNRTEQFAVESTRAQETLNRSENSRVIVEDNDELAGWPGRHSQTTLLQ
jgi:hypothetical protein